MSRLLSRNAMLIPVLLIGVYIVADVAMDKSLDGRGSFFGAHILAGALVLVAASILMLSLANASRREEALRRQAREQLEARVAERTAELEEANEQLRAEIAQRERIEHALRISEETSRALMDASSESAVLTDTRGIILAANETAARGLSTTVEQMIGRSIFGFFPESVAQTRAGYLREVLITGLPVHFEDERAGRFFDIHIQPVHNEEGGIVKTAAFARDVTKLRLADQALRASEEKYRLLFKNMGEGFAIYELLFDEAGRPADWQVLEVNDSYSRHTGLRTETIIGRRMSDLFPGAINEYLPRFASVVCDQAPSSFETFASAVGRYQRVSTFPAGGNRFASTIEDISERKRAEAELRSSEEKFGKMFQYSPDAILLIGGATNSVLDVNDAFTALLGYERDEVLGTKGRQLDLMSQRDALRLRRQFRQHGQVSDVEIDLRTRSGAVTTVLVSIIPITIAEMPCLLVIVHNITARKRSEAALQKAQAELAAGIEARVALEERQRLARELHDSVSQALYGVALGINTALALFDTNREGVLDALHYARSLTRAGLQEMRSLIFELRPESLQTEGLVVALTKQAEAMQARNEIEVSLSLCAEPDLPLPAKEAVYRIAREAMQNAIKHAGLSQLDIRLACTTETLVLQICDNGVGFDPLREYPGHLGLQSMRERAQGQGGTLEIVSAPDCGTQILVTIPIAAESRQLA